VSTARAVEITQVMSTQGDPGYVQFCAWQRSERLKENCDAARSGVYPSYPPPEPKPWWQKAVSAVGVRCRWLLMG